MDRRPATMSLDNPPVMDAAVMRLDRNVTLQWKILPPSGMFWTGVSTCICTRLIWQNSPLWQVLCRSGPRIFNCHQSGPAHEARGLGSQ